MNPIFLVAGAVLGVVFSVATIAGAAWCVQVTISRGLRCGVAASGAIALAQGVWATLAGLVVIWLHGFWESYDWLLRAVASGTLFYMGMTVLQAERLKTVTYDGPLRTPLPVFTSTLANALTMPMRLLGYSACCIAGGLHVREQPLVHAALLGAGAVAGSFAWWFYLALLARLFGHRVPEPITVRSLNKLRVLACIIFLGLIFICSAPLVIWVQNP